MRKKSRVAAAPYPAYKEHEPVGPASAAPPGILTTGDTPSHW